jgi:hypothetical protein
VESYLSCRNQYDTNPECVTEAYDSYGARTIPVQDSFTGEATSWAECVEFKIAYKNPDYSQRITKR